MNKRVYLSTKYSRSIRSRKQIKNKVYRSQDIKDAVTLSDFVWKKSNVCFL